MSAPVSLPFIPLSPSADVGVFTEKGGDTALSAGVLFGDTLRVRLAGDVSSGQQHLLAAAGIGFEKGYALIGLSQAREAVTGFDKQKLKAQGLLAEAAWSVPAAPTALLLRAFVNARLDKASDRHLVTTVAQDTAVTVQDLLQVIQSGNTTRYRTTTTTTTTVTTTTTDQTFRGGERQRLGAGLDLLLRSTTVGHLGLNHQRLSLPGLADQSSTQGTLGLTEYFPGARANASLGLAVGSGSQRQPRPGRRVRQPRPPGPGRAGRAGQQPLAAQPERLGRHARRQPAARRVRWRSLPVGPVGWLGGQRL